MKKWITLFLTASLLCLSRHTMAQTYDFSDRKIPDNWYGQKEHFEISSPGMLHLNAPSGATSSFLSWGIPSYTNYLWECYIKYDFAASSTNYALFYLLSQQQDPGSTINKAYYLKVGGEAGNTDKVELYYRDGTAVTKILESSTGLAGADPLSLRIRLSKSAGGIWTLYADASGGHNFIKNSSGTHVSKEPFFYSAIRCNYSSTRKDKFFIGDIQITQPFAFGNNTFEDGQTLRIAFNKKILDTDIPIASPDLTIPFTTAVTDSILVLHFSTSVPAGMYTIHFNRLYSTDLDTLSDNTLTVEKKALYYTGQIRITELMADPVPSYGLPETEFIELMNTSVAPLNLASYTIQDPTITCKLLPYILQPDSCLILCPKDGCSLYKKNNCMELPCFPGLNNDADSIRLFADDTLLTDAFYYALKTLPSDYRKNGGYSIVRSFMPEECIIDYSTRFSNTSSGGTPGMKEAIPPYTTVTFETQFISDNSFMLTSNITGVLQDTACTLPSAILSINLINKGIQPKWMIQMADSIKSGTALHGMIHSVKTCTGRLKQIEKDIVLIHPAMPLKGDVLINEILYNPYSGGVDFIELYNTTSAYIQLCSSHLYHRDAAGKLQHTLLADPLIIKPFSHLALTSDTSILFSDYPNSDRMNCVHLNLFPSLPDEGGTLMFASAKDTMDVIPYGDVLQNSLSRNTEGTSLEKINTNTSAFSSSNWTSSASGATPGYVNSQVYSSNADAAKPLRCDPCHVTTNLNGQNDFVLLQLTTHENQSFGSLSIYSLTGEKVSELCTNQLLANENTFQWNGQRAGKMLLPAGIYIAVAEWWLPDGRKYECKTPVSTSEY
ncbi:MAG: lamin tail domain-containing protein [Cytophagales bacterium]|nr:lamin tail domain-containing protein [Cytophaga sp.]